MLMIDRLGKPVEMLIPERYRSNHPSHRDKYFSAPSSRAMGAGRELFGLHKNGQELPIEAGKFTIEHIPFDLCLTIEDTLDMLAPTSQDRNLELVGLIDAQAPRTVT